MNVIDQRSWTAQETIVLKSDYAQRWLGEKYKLGEFRGIYLRLDERLIDWEDNIDFANNNELCQADDVIYVTIGGPKIRQGASAVIRKADGTYRRFDHLTSGRIGNTFGSAILGISYGGDRKKYIKAQNRLFAIVVSFTIITFVMIAAYIALRMRMMGR